MNHQAAGSLVVMSKFTPPTRKQQLEAIGGSAPRGSEDLEETAEGWKATAWKEYPEKHKEPEEMAALVKCLRPWPQFFTPLGEQQPGNWLYHFEETGQTFQEYTFSRPNKPTRRNKTIYS